MEQQLVSVIPPTYVKEPKSISIIVPCYNVERYLDRCIHSLTTQTIGVENLQLIFVDDASTDRTARKLQYWQEKFPDSIEIYSLPENRRQGGARNEGLRHASAPFVGFMDSDDWAAPEMYEQLYKAQQQEPCDYSCCYSGRVQSPAEELNPFVCENRKILIRTEEERKNFLIKKVPGIKKMPGGVYCHLFRRDFLEKNAVEFPEHTAFEDNYWMAMLRLSASSFYLVGRELYYYFVNWQSTTLSADSRRHLDRLAIEVAKLEEYRRRGVFHRYYREFEYEFLRLYYINSIHTFFVRISDMHGLPFAGMQETVRRNFPDYKNNPYLHYFIPLEHELLKTLELELSDDQWQLLAQEYRKSYGMGNAL